MGIGSKVIIQENAVLGNGEKQGLKVQHFLEISVIPILLL